MHILYVVPTLSRGGMETLLVSTIAPLIARGNDVSVFCARGRGDLADRAESLGASIFVASGFGSLGAAVRLIALCLRIRPDLLHGKMTGVLVPLVVAGLVLRKTPVVFSLESSHEWDLPRTIRRVAKAWLLKLATRHIFSVTVAVSEGVRLSVTEALMLGEAISVIENGVDLEVFSPGSTMQRLESRRALGVSQDDFLVVSIGRLVPVKAHSVLVDAVALARDTQMRVLVFGQGPELQRLQSQCAAVGVQGVVDFRGETDDIASVLRAADLFVLPSLSEGTPVTLLEAMATGVPVIVTDVGINRSIIGPDGGFIAAPGDSFAVARAIVAVSTDYQQALRMARTGRGRIVERFGLDRFVRDWESVYAKAVRER